MTRTQTGVEVRKAQLNDAAPRSQARLPSGLVRLDEELRRLGWATSPRFGDSLPSLLVYCAQTPHFGETVTVRPGTRPGQWWYVASGGERLADYPDAALAAARLTSTLLPWVRAALGHPPSPSQPLTIFELRRRLPDVPCWWGHRTREWWAMVGEGDDFRLVHAATVDDLARAIATAQQRHR
ncbi:hypothetical protein DZF91_36080 [Actinomadura logoneensis]|uniref:Uncharacterized protein n=1 Tax=Actinomadura logoneensis TaxID=2293572 RepID=A0A372J9Z1_9ACTN|nr:hypothetical protein [Actinomadura logoneensis]RFU36831.1 hypothetical protein DZF91_36080 [Actinomadura logoneensis]